MAEIITNSTEGFTGKINIADEVIATIAGTAAMEVEGVASMVGNISDIAELLGKKNLSKGVKLEVNEQEASIELNLFIKSGYKIPEVCTDVQDRVKTAVEIMSGLKVVEVNVNISGLATEKPAAKKDMKVNDN